KCIVPRICSGCAKATRRIPSRTGRPETGISQEVSMPATIKTVSALTIAALAWALPAVGQEGNVIQLDTITLIGTGLPTELMHNPASITVIDAETIQRRGPVSVATLLREVPGVQISEEGIERIVI